MVNVKRITQKNVNIFCLKISIILIGKYMAEFWYIFVILQLY